MGFVKDIGRARPVQAGLGRAAAGYLRLVRRTNRFVLDPPDLHDRVAPLKPFIVTFWHGQHFMMPFLRREGDRFAALVSRSGDGELNAIVLEALGTRAVRGSGARGRDVRAKGGAPALRALIRALADGEGVCLTADVPKIARRCGEGVVLLARLSGRPIVPAAAATSRRLEFGSWDRATLGLPFGRGALVAGEPLWVPPDADAAALEAARGALEAELDRVQALAFARVGRGDPMARR